MTGAPTATECTMILYRFHCPSCRLAHSERAVIAEAALRELGFTDDDV
jgi:hypothetical protein